MGEEPSKLGTGLAWFGLILMTTLVMIRAMVEHDAFPWWEADPFVFSPPVIGLTPMKALMLNLGVVLSSCMVLIGLFLRKDRVGTLSAVLLALGVLVIGYHGFQTLESVLEGSNLLAIVSVLYIASCAHKIGGAQQVITAVTLGFVVLLVMMGAYDMFVIHPDTVANYQQTRDSFLAARGWSPGSFEALAYERRLFQPEPIAWFGLTNVFASFAGAGAAGFFILGWGLRKTDRFSVIFLLSGMIALAGLLMTGAKGGIGAFGLGMGLTIAAMLITRRKLNGRAIAGICGVVILGVIARGFIGECLGELSLLFRSQYMSGSMSMFFENLPFGVGPGAFQDHYTIVKPALSPEDVASAHSFGFDLIAMLGIGGLALVGVLISIIARIRPLDADEPESQFNRRQTIQITMLMIAVASAISIRIGSLAMDMNLLLVQVFGSLAWAGLAYVIMTRNNLGRAMRWAMFAVAAVLAIHSMIEVSGTWMVSGMLWALMIGNACSSSPCRDREQSKLSVMPIVAGAGLLISGITLGMNLPTILKWERSLNDAAWPAKQISNLRGQLDSLETSGTPDQLREQIASDLTDLVGYRVTSSIDQIVTELNQAEFNGRVLASEHLIQACKIRLTHMPTFIAASQQLLWQASVLGSQGLHDESEVIWDQALDLLDVGVTNSTGSSGYQWLGSVWFGRAMQFPNNPSRESWLTQANLAWLEALSRSPHNPHLAVKLMDVSIERWLSQEASEWANRALELHDQSRLDPLRGLGESDLMRVRAAAR